MNDEVKFIIYGLPIAKKRHRTFTRNGRTIAYDPQDKLKKEVKNIFFEWITNATNGSDKEMQMKAHSLALAESFEVDMRLYITLPESWSNSKKNRFLWFNETNIKPDNDNVTKFYFDCANGIIWKDDKQIIDNRTRKNYSNIARTEIKIRGIMKKEVDPRIEDILSFFSPYEISQFLLTFEDASFQTFCALEFDELSPNEKMEYAKKSARLISQVADLYADKLKKIKSKYPNYWKE